MVGEEKATCLVYVTRWVIIGKRGTSNVWKAQDMWKVYGDANVKVHSR